ncbi:hypothetical protein D3C81_1391940 [compost metagenome]
MRIATVGVDAAENPQRNGRGNLVMEAMPGQGRVVGLDVDLDFVLQPELLKKAEHGGAVVIVLVFGRLLRLGFDQQVAGETDLVLVLDHHAHKAAELFAFTLQVRVEQGFVAFATAP